MRVATESPVVEANGIGHVYRNGTRALLPMDLTARRGEFITLLGPSGCGKSTLLKIIASLISPTQGELRLWGKAMSFEKGGQKEIAFVFQESTLMPWCSVETNVRLPLDLRGMPRSEASTRVAEALDLVGLSAFARVLPRQLSGGMQMRASIARALVVHPNLLLMDEPFAALDEITRNRLDSDLLELWKKKNLTVVFVTHSIQEAVFLSTRVLVMAARPGRLVGEVAIEVTAPRDSDFRVSTLFSQYAKRLQDDLLRASADDPQSETQQ